MGIKFGDKCDAKIIKRNYRDAVDIARTSDYFALIYKHLKIAKVDMMKFVDPMGPWPKKHNCEEAMEAIIQLRIAKDRISSIPPPATPPYSPESPTPSAYRHEDTIASPDMALDDNNPLAIDLNPYNHNEDKDIWDIVLSEDYDEEAPSHSDPNTHRKDIEEIITHFSRNKKNKLVTTFKVSWVGYNITEEIEVDSAIRAKRLMREYLKKQTNVKLKNLYLKNPRLVEIVNSK